MALDLISNRGALSSSGEYQDKVRRRHPHRREVDFRSDCSELSERGLALGSAVNAFPIFRHTLFHTPAPPSSDNALFPFLNHLNQSWPMDQNR